MRRTKFDDDHDSKDDHKTYKFKSTGKLWVSFWDDSDVEPGGNAKADVVCVTGSGEWDGKSGYTFEMKAVDDGEPGKKRDHFKIIIRDAQGNTVASVSEEINSGNIQSSTPPK